MALLENYVAQPPPFKELEDGTIRMRGTRVPLDAVVYSYKEGATPEDIIRSYTTLNLRDVYAAITFYLDNQNQVDAYLKKREEEADELQRVIEANQPSNAEFRARLDARLAEKAGSSHAISHG